MSPTVVRSCENSQHCSAIRLELKALVKNPETGCEKY